MSQAEYIAPQYLVIHEYRSKYGMLAACMMPCAIALSDVTALLPKYSWGMKGVVAMYASLLSVCRRRAVKFVSAASYMA